jgi:hypothetical protein
MTGEAGSASFHAGSFQAPLNDAIQLALKPLILRTDQAHGYRAFSGLLHVALVQYHVIGLDQGDVAFQIVVPRHHGDGDADHADDDGQIDFFFEVPPDRLRGALGGVWLGVVLGHVRSLNK